MKYRLMYIFVKTSGFVVRNIRRTTSVHLRCTRDTRPSSARPRENALGAVKCSGAFASSLRVRNAGFPGELDPLQRLGKPSLCGEFREAELEPGDRQGQ